jgi:hypothetical protein
MVAGIVGAVLALVIGALVTLATRRKARAFLAALAARGPTAMRAEIDRTLPPATALDRKNAWRVRERMAALALVGDLAAVEREVATQQGGLDALAVAQSAGLYALTLHGREPAQAAERLAALARRAEAELTGMKARLLVPPTRALAELGAALAGRGAPPATTVTLERFVRQQPLVRLVVWQGLARACEAHGDARAARFKAELQRLQGGAGATS